MNGCCVIVSLCFTFCEMPCYKFNVDHLQAGVYMKHNICDNFFLLLYIKENICMFLCCEKTAVDAVCSLLTLRMYVGSSKHANCIFYSLIVVLAVSDKRTRKLVDGLECS